MKKPRKFITVIIKKRRKLGIQEPTDIPDDKPVETLPTMFADGLKPSPSVKSKGRLNLWKS